MTTTTDRKTVGTESYTVIGTRPIRHDGVDKVTGRAQYGADIRLPGLLHGKLLRSPHAHARIKSIDVSQALKVPGVKAVVTGADFPVISAKVVDLGEGAIQNSGFLSMNVMARDKALYRGHAIAAVAATSAHVAEEATSLIKVDYEVLKPVLDGLEAMKPDAPLVHERLATVTNPAMRPGGYKDDSDTSRGSNVSNHFVFEIGDIARGFKEADVIVEREYHTRPVHQGYIEPHSATARWSADGSLTVWCSSQGQFAMRDQTARLLNIPVSKVKVIPMEIGGGFGGKTVVYLEPVAALLARKCGQPVKLTMSRTEVFEGTGPTSGGYIKIKMGATKQGRITACQAALIYEAGAFPGSPVNPGAQCMLGPYDIPNARVEGYDVVLNTPKVAAYRAPGAPAAALAAETVVDELCEKLKMDPIDFRILNGAKEGTRRVSGPIFPKIGNIEMLQAAKDSEHVRSKLTGKMRGRGMASGFWINGAGPSTCTASVNPDGTISLVEGSPDIGGSRAAVAMHAAEVLGLPAEDVHPLVADTDSIGFTSTTGGSGVAFKTGWAAYEAAQDVKRQMIERAARVWQVKPEDVELADGVFQHKSDPALKLTFKQLAARVLETGGPVVGRAAVSPRGVGSAFAFHIVDLEVDPDTGKVTLLRYTALQDAGKAVHPSYVENQIQGGVSQGVGWALNEEYVFNDQGVMANPTFLDYRMPTALDLPMIDTVIVEVPNPGHPYGVRGVGEVPLVPPLAAVANAIYHATGVRMQHLPMHPGRVIEALKHGADPVDMKWTFSGGSVQANLGGGLVAEEH
ncbi:MAG: xanthine dehydrogenase family protein molybdopterin-binding subunit [SAR202 cluster bacterium]|nr:xanthine dehydrogenase family protein molybdopterin-binding subunit [SAR202 cluster bacterium]